VGLGLPFWWSSRCSWTADFGGIYLGVQYGRGDRDCYRDGDGVAGVDDHDAFVGLRQHAILISSRRASSPWGWFQSLSLSGGVVFLGEPDLAPPISQWLGWIDGCPGAAGAHRVQGGFRFQFRRMNLACCALLTVCLALCVARGSIVLSRPLSVEDAAQCDRHTVRVFAILGCYRKLDPTADSTCSMVARRLRRVCQSEQCGVGC